MTNERVNTKDLLALFVPMALSSWLGWLAPPFINAAVARVSDSSETALAAFGVARNLTMLMSPFAVMVPSAVLVLVTGLPSRTQVARFLALLSAGLSAFTLLILLTPLRRPFLGGLLGLETGLADRTGWTLLILVLQPPLSIWRGFSQGQLIKQQRTGAMVWAGALGFAVAAVSVMLAGRVAGITGEAYGAFILVASTFADAALLQYLISRTSSPAGDGAVPGFLYILRYFLPLVVTTWIMAASRTMIDAGLARTPEPATALATFSLAASFVFAFEAPIVMLRSVALAYDHDEENRRRLRRFSIAVGAVMAVVTLGAGFTPLVGLLLGEKASVVGPIGVLTRWCIRIMAVSLLILSWRQFSYSVLMKRHRTDIIALSAVVRMAFLAVAVLGGLWLLPDVRLAAVAYTLGFLIESFICAAGTRRIGAD